MAFTRAQYEEICRRTGQPSQLPGHAIANLAVKTKRIRQSAKPLMNRLEQEYYERLKQNISLDLIHCQAITLKLANGLRYTPDFFVFQDERIDSRTNAYEVKGKWVDGDSFPKLKMAAAVYKEVKFYLVWKQDGVWTEQIVLP